MGRDTFVGHRNNRDLSRRTWTLVSLLLALAIIGSGDRTGGGTALAQGGGTFKVAFWNIQSGFGERPLAGGTCSFSESSNCTDASRPLNAWGMHVVQDELIQSIGNDPSVIALGLVEAWSCATPGAVQQVLGWASRSSVKAGLALLARYGFAGPEEWVQLDTSNNINPAETTFVLRVPVCLDRNCTRAVTVYATHLFVEALTQADDYAGYATQSGQVLDFAARASGIEPHVVIGDFNMFEGTAIVCEQEPKNEGIRLFRSAGYLDAWPSLHATADGSTGMWNRAGCGVPEGNLWKRIDFSWSKRLNPLEVSRFGMVAPGQCAPSDHAGILVEYALEDASAPAPALVIKAPVQDAAVAGHVWLSAQVTNGVGVSRLEWLLDGRVIAVQTGGALVFDWDASQVANGPHVLQAAATSLAGRRGTSPPHPLTVLNPSGPDDEVVLYAKDATIAGTGWSFVADATAAAGIRLQNANAGLTTTVARSQPSGYAELIFDAIAGTPYRLWIRGKAIANRPENDAVFVQFSDAVDGSGAPVFRIGTDKSTRVNLEDCGGCGLSNWGWQDNESGRDVLGTLIYFAASGSHRLRIQAREDGLGIDQVVLSAIAYRFGAPGGLVNDATILPRPGTPANRAPVVQLTAPAAGTSVTAPAAVSLTATASDPDDAVARVEFLAGTTVIGQDTSAPYTATWTAATAGSHVLTARATDTRGARTTSAGVPVTVLPAGSTTIDEIVVHAAKQAQILGGWSVVTDATAAGGARLQNANASAPKLSAALAAPTRAFEVTFTAEAGKGYRLWLRGKAQDDSYANDSVFVQFAGSVTASGTATWRIGTTSATPVVLEDCSGCGLQGWGWADNAYGSGVLGPLVYFAQSGPQRLRIQIREDGVGLDQVVLSAVKYLTTRPGATKNDATILPSTGTQPP